MRRRTASVLLVVAAGVGSAVVVAMADDEPSWPGPAVTVRAPGGELLADVPLGGDRFAVQYRNSIYTTLAEERYHVSPDGRFEVVELAADQLAVLEEYYAVPGAPRPAPAGDRRGYVAEPDPARPAVFDVLRIAATDLGERTLLVPGQPPVPLWQLVDEDVTVIVEIEES